MVDVSPVVFVGALSGPAIFAGSFGYFIGDSAPTHLPGAPFYIAAVLLLVAVFVAWRHAPRALPATSAQVDAA